MNNVPEYTKENWRLGAACSDPYEVDPNWFYEGPFERAKRICGKCAVRAECLEYAIEHSESFGVWGGLTERQRKAEARRQPGRGVRRESE